MNDHELDDRLRQAIGVLVESAPDPAPYPGSRIDRPRGPSSVPPGIDRGRSGR